MRKRPSGTGSPPSTSIVAEAAKDHGFEGTKVVAGELLQARVQEAGALLGHYLRAFALYVAIMGALVKFALDKDSTPQLRSALALLGLGLCLLGFLACVLGQIVARKLLAEIRTLCLVTELPVPRTSVLPLEFTALTTVLFVAIAISTWLYVFRW
jgi:hypothetical protein